MKRFADLYTALDETNKTNEKVAALVDYFDGTPAADAAWAVYFLIGRRPRRAMRSRQLAEWATEETNLPDWLWRESYDAVGDMAETITLLLPENEATSTDPLHVWVEDVLLPLKGMGEAEQRDAITRAWGQLNTRQRFVFNKLITGGFRVGVSQKLVIRALSDFSGVNRAVIAHRMMGDWNPTPDFYESLITEADESEDISRPYPFFLAYPIDDNPLDELDSDDVTGWQAEWKWDGIRAQAIRRQGESFVWSRGEELVTDRYPEVTDVVNTLPDGTVLDGELLPWKDDNVLPFAELQRRIGRKTIGKKLLKDVPVIFMAYDLLEQGGEDVREQPLEWRRAQLEHLIAEVNQPHLLISPLAHGTTWDELAASRAESRDRKVEGLMLKRKSSPYRVGRQRGDWWKWKIEPFTVDAVMIYAQRGSGKRASLYTDYTFAVWDADGQLVPFAKAYSGLTDKEIRKVDNWVRRHAVESFGPVRSVKPELVFEIAFEGIRESSRHKSGVAVRFPRILRWRQDKPPAEADTLETVKALLPD
jgi:DNA ligase 1